MRRVRALGLAIAVGSFACSDEDAPVSPEGDAGNVGPCCAEAGKADAARDAGGGGSTDSSVPSGDDDDVSAPPPINCAVPQASRGATLPYQEYEAEDSDTNGTLVGPSRAVDDADLMASVAGESSGRKAIKLTGTGQYVRVKSACAANAIVVRYAIPDSGDGNGINASLGVYVDGQRVQTLALTSHYAWAYGNTQTTTTTTNNPADGHARHFYDESRVLLGVNVAEGSTVSVQKDTNDSAYVIVDLIDLEAVQPPATPPANALSITDCGATPDDGSDDTNAIQKCLVDGQAQGRPVWIPRGNFDVRSAALKAASVKMQGAGMWYSALRGASAQVVCRGGGCQLADFAMLGEVTYRDDTASVHAVSGIFGTGSRMDNLWVEHFTTGSWVGQSNAAAADGLVIHGCRFRDLFADGVNFCNGTKNSIIEQSHARNVGDDAFASWAISSSPANTNNKFRFNTVQIPWKANCFAIYGGTNNAIEDNICADVVTYPGIFIDQGFGSNPFGGTTSIARNTIVRGGGPMYSAQWGALTVSGSQKSSPIVGVQISDIDIQSATYSGIFVTGPNTPINGLSLTNIKITSPGTYGIHVDPSAIGSATAVGVTVANPGSGIGLNNEAPSAYTFQRGSGNSGW